ATASPRIFHILWNNKFELFDRTVLMLYYKLRGKKIVLTAHNVNAGRRDARDSMINRLTLKTQYRLADHIFVHAEAMKRELLEDFGVREGAITVIPIGINNSVPDTDLTGEQARQRLGIGRGDRTILFFGYIGPYKGVELLVDAFQRLASTDPRWRLVIAGKPKKGDEKYFAEIQRAIERDVSRWRVLQRIGFIPDEETEWYFKAADVLVLPYTRVYAEGDDEDVSRSEHGEAATTDGERWLARVQRREVSPEYIDEAPGARLRGFRADHRRQRVDRQNA